MRMRRGAVFGLLVAVLAALGLLAGLDAARGREFPRGAREPGEIHAAVVQEAVVLRGEHGLDQQRRDPVVLHRRAAHLAELAHQQAVPAVDAQRFLEAHVPQHVHRGQPGPQVQQGACDGDHSCRNRRQDDEAQSPAPD